MLPFFFFLVERTAAVRAKDLQLPETTRNRVYAAAWIMIFALSGLVVGFWMMPAKAAEAMMRGRVSGLPAHQRLRGTGPETANVRVFTYRDPQETNQLFWRTLSNDPLDEKSELTFLIDNSTQTSDETLRFPFQTSRDYYGSSMELRFRFDPVKKKLVFENAPKGAPAELAGEKIVIAGEEPPRVVGSGGLPWFGAVFAQSKPKAAAVIAKLDDDDPLIRLTARKQLASLGLEAASHMDQSLADPDSSYRVKLGVIVAANQMSGFRPEALSATAWCGVWHSAQSGDETMKAQASLLLQKDTQTVSASSCRNLQLKGNRSKSSIGSQAVRTKSKN